MTDLDKIIERVEVLLSDKEKQEYTEMMRDFRRCGLINIVKYLLDRLTKTRQIRG